MKMTRNNLYKRVRQILESARTNVARSVNTTQVIANWLIGREIVEEEQHGTKRAKYGQKVIPFISTTSSVKICQLSLFISFKKSNAVLPSACLQ